MTLKRIGDATMIADAVVHNGVVYLAGHVAEDPVSDSVYEQTKNVLAQIDATLKAAGTDKTKILRANIWLSDITTFPDMNKAWKEWVATGQAPARATVEAKLAFPKWKVEIMMTAAV
jgi:enamine deaminase RidA (YjgF/YER057c/UK114 family)